MMTFVKLIKRTLFSILILCSFLSFLNCISIPTVTPAPTAKPAPHQSAGGRTFLTIDDHPTPKIEITDADDNYACLTNHRLEAKDVHDYQKCEKINRYYVKDAEYNCYMENLEIMYDAHIIIPDTTAAATGYLKPNGVRNNIVSAQSKSKLCPLIRR